MRSRWLVTGAAAGWLLAAGAESQQAASPPGHLLFLGWTENLEHSVWLSGVDPGEYFVVFPETGARIDTWTQAERGLHLTISPEVREYGGTHNLFIHVRDQFSEYDNFVDSDDQRPGRFTFPNHWDRPPTDLPDTITPELRPAPDTVTPELPVNPGTVTPELRPNPDVQTPTLRPIPNTMIPELRPAPDITTPEVRPPPDTLTPEERPSPDTLTPELRPTPDTLTPELRPTPGTVTPGLRPAPDIETPTLRPSPDTLTPELRPTPGTVTPGLRPAPDTLTPALRPNPGTVTPGLRPAPDIETPTLRPSPDTLTPELRPTPDTLTPELRPTPDTVTPGLRPAPDTLTPALRPNPGTVTPGLRPAPDTLTPELRPTPGTVTPGLRPAPDIETPTLRPAPDTLTPELRPTPDTLTPELRPTPGTVTPGLRPAPDIETPTLRPAPDTLTPELRPTPDTLTPELRPTPGTVTPGLRPAPDIETPTLRPAPDTLTPELRPTPDALTPELRPTPGTVTPGLRPTPGTVTPGLRPTPDTVTPELRPTPDTETPAIRPRPGTLPSLRLPGPIPPAGVPQGTGERRVVMTAAQVCRDGRAGRLRIDAATLKRACDIDAAARRRWTAWSEWSHISLSDRRFGGRAEGSSHRVTFGLDRQVDSRTATGVALEFGRSRYESFKGQLRQSTDEIVLRPYVVHRINASPLLVDADVGFHFSNYKEDVLVLSGKHDTFALSGTVGVSTQHATGGLTFRPRLSVSYAGVWHDSFALEGDLAGLHLRLPQRDVRYDFGTVAGSLEISRPFRLGGGKVAPYLQGSIDFAFQRPNGGRVLTPGLDLVATSAVVGSARAGARAYVRRTLTLAGSVAYEGIGSPGLSSWEWRAYLSFRF